MEEKRAHIVVDVQPDFTLGGPLPAPRGNEIIEPNNRIMAAFHALGHLTATSQDWHRPETAHISETPNFVDTWPAHCIIGTPGAALHPNLKPAATSKRFVKGDVPVRNVKDDRSYSAYYAHDETGLLMPDYLRRNGVRKVSVGGIATDYCVGKTALDFHNNGFEVTFVSDASASIAPDTETAMLAEFKKRGIRIMTTAALLAEVQR